MFWGPKVGWLKTRIFLWAKQSILMSQRRLQCKKQVKQEAAKRGIKRNLRFFDKPAGSKRDAEKLELFIIHVGAVHAKHLLLKHRRPGRLHAARCRSPIKAGAPKFADAELRLLHLDVLLEAIDAKLSKVVCEEAHAPAAALAVSAHLRAERAGVKADFPGAAQDTTPNAVFGISMQVSFNNWISECKYVDAGKPQILTFNILTHVRKDTHFRACRSCAA